VLGSRRRENRAPLKPVAAAHHAALAQLIAAHRAGRFEMPEAGAAHLEAQIIGRDVTAQEPAHLIRRQGRGDVPAIRRPSRR
jgi:hypothetical protein